MSDNYSREETIRGNTVAGQPHNSLIFILFDDHLLASHLKIVTQKVYDDKLSCKETCEQ